MPVTTKPAFAASFRFDPSSGSRETPIPNPRGLEPPPGWGDGFKNTHFEWLVYLPDDSLQTWALSDPLRVGASKGKPGEYGANGNLFIIDVVGYNQGAVVANPIVQITAYTTDDDTRDGAITHIDPPFSGVLWPPFSLSGVAATIPDRGGAPMITCTPPVNCPPLTLDEHYGNDEQGRPLHGQSIVSFTFNNNLRGLVARRNNLFIDVAIYLTLDGVQCFDDPEMEIDLGSN